MADFPLQVFREYDIRGLVPSELNPETMALIGKGFGTHLCSLNLKTISVGGDYLSEAELPASIDSRSSLHMLVPMSCGMMNFPDAQLIDALGYRF